jgi:phospholipase C
MTRENPTRLQKLERRFALFHLRKHRDDEDRTASPHPHLPLGQDALPQVKHIVILMMENHSYDNYFGMLTDPKSGRQHGNGFTLDASGKPTAECPTQDKKTMVRAFDFYPETEQAKGAPSQAWYASQVQYDGGSNDGFVSSTELTEPDSNRTVGMGYWTGQSLPFYYGLATTFPLADQWYCSCLGPTFPNRRFLMAGTANGLIDDVPLNMADYPASGTIFDLLDRNYITWANYHHARKWKTLFKHSLGAPVLRAARWIGNLLSRLFPLLVKWTEGNIQLTAALYPLGVFRVARHVKPIEKFFEDAENGQLPDVCIVDPDFQQASEENPQDVQDGEEFAARVINAVMHGKGWADTLLIWLYDEHGGYYDHVPPPEAVEPDQKLARSLLDWRQPFPWLLKRLGVWKRLNEIDDGNRRYNRYGFRVPAVIVSPYAKPGYVTSEIYDHTSVLKLIERKWNLPPLTRRDALAKDPLDALDFTAPPPFLVPPTLPSPGKNANITQAPPK